MTTKDLIGKEIIEMRSAISRVEYEGSIPLEIIDVEMLLLSGEIVSFPHYPEAEKLECEKFNLSLKKIFPRRNILKTFIKPNKIENLKNEKIIGIWSIDDDFGDKICAIEFQNGYFICKGPMSPIGIGNADLFLFESKTKMENKYESELQKVF